MNILLTNDDGYQSPGINKLADKLSEKHNVFIVAPDTNRSAVSHHYTMFNENTIKKIGDRKWSCSGYPADCVFAGLSGNLFEEKIDVVLSGINYGPNMGTDIIYSGTCAAARQAILQGYDAIALSVDPIDWSLVKEQGIKFDALIDFVDKNLETLITLVKKDIPRAFVNVNGASLDKYKGVRQLDDICERKYNDIMKVTAVSDTEYKTSIEFGDNTTDPVEGQDFKVCRDGYVAINRIYADPISCPSIDGVTFLL